MSQEDWKAKYEQLNLRSRWYSSQLWYVPFAYVGLVGLGLEKILGFAVPLKGFALLFVGLFTLSVYVHVSSLKYFERRAVRHMQEMEVDKISGGGSPSYLSFAWYIRIVLLFATYGFLGFGAFELNLPKFAELFVFCILMAILTALFSAIVVGDAKRNRELVQAIRSETR